MTVALAVKLGTHDYIIDLGLQEFREESIPRQSDQQFISTPELGETSLNRKGVWRRGWDSWHHGAGQEEADLADSLRTRYRISHGVNPWKKGELSLLNGVEKVLDTSASGSEPGTTGFVNRMATYPAYSYIWLTHHLEEVEFCGNALDATPTWTPMTGFPVDVNVRGTEYVPSLFKCFFATQSDGLYSADFATPTAVTQWTTDPGAGLNGVTYARQRLVGWSDDELYDWTAASDSTVKVDFPTGVEIVNVTEGQTALLVGANDDRGGVIFRVPLLADGTGLDVATVIGRLPAGERLSWIQAYLGYVLIGASTTGVSQSSGARLAAVSGADLTFGPLISNLENQITTPQDMYAEGRFVYAATPTSRLNRYDLSTFVDTLAPAWAPDLESPTFGVASAVRGIGGRKFFYIDGDGLYREKTTPVAAGYLDTGVFRYGLTEPKIVHDADVFISQGSATMALRSPNTAFGAPSGAPDYSLGNISMANPEVEITLTNDAVIDGFVVRATPATDDGEFIVLPILLYQHVTYDGAEHTFDSAAELEYIRSLRRSQQTVQLNRGGLIDTVTIDDYVWRPEKEYSRVSSEIARWAGVLFVKCKTL